MIRRIGLKTPRSNKRQSPQLPRPDNLPADDVMVSLDIRCHFVPSVVLELVRRHITPHHLHRPGTLQRIRQGVVNVLPVSLRVRPITPEHLHRLQPAGVRVAQKVPVRFANPALSQERKGIHVFRSLCHNVHSVLQTSHHFLASLLMEERNDWAHGLINGESLKNERTEHGPSTNANRNGISPSPYPRNRSSSPLRG